MATHDPLTVAGLTKQDVLLMRRDSAGLVRATPPREDPKGMGVAALLTSEVYGLRSELDEDTLADLDEKRELAIKDQLTPMDRERLTELNRKLDALDFRMPVRDPMYRPFVEAMTRLESELELDGAALTPEQYRLREELATVVVETLRALPSFQLFSQAMAQLQDQQEVNANASTPEEENQLRRIATEVLEIVQTARPKLQPR